MAGEGRRSAGFGDALHSFDASDWTSEEKPSKPRPDRTETRKAAELVGFKSREGEKAAVAEIAPAAPKQPPKQRRWRTGRNVQFNVRATQGTIEAFTAIADKNGWSIGETFEKATSLLAQHHGTDQPD